MTLKVYHLMEKTKDNKINGVSFKEEKQVLYLCFNLSFSEGSFVLKLNF